MPSTSFYQNYLQIVEAGSFCQERNLYLPQLILAFTLIDTMAWAASPKSKKAVRANFEKWVTKWVIPHLEESCTATELYAARCGVLHTLSSEADLTKSGEARQVVYTWGTAQVSDLAAVTENLRPGEFVALHVESLFAAICRGMNQFIEHGVGDDAISMRLEDASRLQFCQLEPEKVVQFLAQTEARS